MLAIAPRDFPSWSCLFFSFVLFLTASAIGSPAAPIAAFPGYQPYSEQILAEGAAHPERYIQDPQFARQFAKHYQIRLYDLYMHSYMDAHNLTSPPVPYSAVQKIIEAADEVPHPILLEMIFSHFGSSAIITVLMNEISLFEKSKGMKASLSPDLAEVLSPATQNAIDALNRRLEDIESRVGSSMNFRMKDIALFLMSGCALLLSVLALARKS